MTLLKRILTIIRHPGALLYPNSYSHERFLEYLRENGAKIGTNTRFISPSKCSIDPGRLDYIEIGDNCCLSVVTILAHDYSWYTFLEAFNDVVPDSGGEVVIGNNVFVGYQACILKDTHIGDNVIIGARSLVKGDIPSNTVWAGVPAKQICTLEEFYQKRSNKVDSACYRYQHLKKKLDRDPTIEEMGGLFGMLFIERTEENYNKYIRNIEINGVSNNEKLRTYFFDSKPDFISYEEFVNHANR